MGQKKWNYILLTFFSQKQTMPLNCQGKIITELDFYIIYLLMCSFSVVKIMVVNIQIVQSNCTFKNFYLQRNLNMIIDILQFKYPQENYLKYAIKQEGCMILG